jgi:hypothetical protein
VAYPGVGTERLRSVVPLLVACQISACAPEASQVAPHAAPTRINVSTAFGGKPLRLRSERMRLSVEVPDGAAWEFEKAPQGIFAVRHVPSRSRLVIQFFDELELVNRSKCRKAAEERRLVQGAPFGWLENEVVTGPQVYDTVLSVGVAHGTVLRGTVLATGAFLRKCMVFQFETELAPGESETVLADKLARARSMVFETMTLDPMRTGVTAEVPEEPRSPQR